MIEICYQDEATFVKVGASGYSNDKVVLEQEVVPVVFVQNTQFSRSNYQDSIESDAVCWPDPDSQFVIDNFHRLEGMYVIQQLYGSPDNVSWYKVVDVTTNRDHLLDNITDNIELRLKKTRPVPGVS